MHSSNQYLSDKIFHLKNKISPNITKTSHLQVIKPLLGDVVGVIPQLLHGSELLPQEDGGLGLLCQLLSSGDDVDDLLLLFVDLVHHLQSKLDQVVKTHSDHLQVLLNDVLSGRYRACIIFICQSHGLDVGQKWENEGLNLR